MPPKKKAKNKGKQVSEDASQQDAELLKDVDADEESQEKSVKEGAFGGEADADEMDEYLDGISDHSDKAKAAL